MTLKEQIKTEVERLQTNRKETSDFAALTRGQTDSADEIAENIIRIVREHLRGKSD